MTPRIQRQLTLLAGSILLLGSAASARADYNFNFNSLTPSTADQSSNPIGGSNAIALYMDSVLNCSNCVTVSGLDGNGNTGSGSGYGVAVAQKYAGDGFVVGPGGKPVTLGNSDGAKDNTATPGAYDSYISNTEADSNGNNPSNLSQGILITFSHGVSLTGTLSFDYEIFPDGLCPSLNSGSSITCGTANSNLPDLTFTASGGTTSINTTFWGAVPGTTNGSSTQSPNDNPEKAPQLIGHWSGTVSGATSLKFMDWPATIGIDNLTLTPEPRGGVFLLGALALVAIAGTKLRREPSKS